MLPIFDGAVAGPCRASPAGTGIKRVLIVRLDAIGDFVVWQDAAAAIRSLYPPPAFEITLLGNGAWAELALAQPHFDRVWSLDKRRFFRDFRYRAGIVRRVRRAGFAVALQPTYSREYHYGDAIVRASGAAQRLGFDGDLSNMTAAQKRAGDGWYTHLVPASPEPLAELERNAELVRGIGAGNHQARMPVLAFSESAAGLDFDGPYYVLFLGAAAAYRKWPAANYAEIARRLHRQTGWAGVACGGPDDAAAGDELARTAGVPLRNLAGRTTLPGLAAVIAGAKLVIGNETSAVHIAAALGTPSVCILGGGHFGRFVPYPDGLAGSGSEPVAVYKRMPCFNCDWTCEFTVAPGAPYPCIEEVTADDAWRVIADAVRPATVAPTTVSEAADA